MQLSSEVFLRAFVARTRQDMIISPCTDVTELAPGILLATEFTDEIGPFMPCLVYDPAVWSIPLAAQQDDAEIQEIARQCHNDIGVVSYAQTLGYQVDPSSFMAQAREQLHTWAHRYLVANATQWHDAPVDIRERLEQMDT